MRIFHSWKDPLRIILLFSFVLFFSWPKLFLPWNIAFKKKKTLRPLHYSNIWVDLKGQYPEPTNETYYQKKGRKTILPRKGLSQKCPLGFSDHPRFSPTQSSPGIKTWFWNCDLQSMKLFVLIPHLFFKFNVDFILEYSWFTILLVSGVQENDSVIHTRIYCFSNYFPI